MTYLEFQSQIDKIDKEIADAKRRGMSVIGLEEQRKELIDYWRSPPES